MKKKQSPKRPGKHFAVNIISVDEDGNTLPFERPDISNETPDHNAPSGTTRKKVMHSKKLPEESKIQVKFLMPDEGGMNLVRANGSVKWFRQVKEKNKKSFVMGVCFRDITPEDREKLMHLWKTYG